MKLPMQGWNLYHKAVMTLVVAFFFGLFLRAVVSVSGGGIPSESSIDIDRSAASLWPLVTDNANRIRWEAHVIDITRLSGLPVEPGSTRLVFWKTPRLKRWQSLEGTLETVPERRLYLRRESDTAQRWFEITLDPQGPCRTRVTIREQYRPKAYGKRYMAFLESGDLQDRLDISAQALDRWARSLEPCGEAAEGDT